MQLIEMVRYALGALRYRKLRSWLTISGIIVGICTIVVLVGLVQGLKDSITDQIKGFGSNTIIISPATLQGTGTAGTAFSTARGKLYLKDYERVKKVAEIEYITPVITGAINTKYKDKQLTLSVYGVEPDLFRQTTSTIKIEKGRFLADNERGAIVLGHNTGYTKFDQKIELGAPIYLGEKKFKVIGVLESIGSSFTSFDDAVYISIEDAREIFSNRLAENEITAIRITTKEGTNVEEVADEINQIMLSSHRVKEDEKDFTVTTAASINQRVENVTSVLTLFMGAIAGISLIVGGIGITNTMFMAVLERTREIGTLKALGAREKEIKELFLVESAMISIAGGIIGLVLAYLLINLINFSGVVPAVFIPWVAVGAVLFSAAIGIIAGYVPASQAAKLDPVEALRYE
ncbi:MAG: ABC transporter permease [Candidatus Bilamarchaeaceae archaeon]